MSSEVFDVAGGLWSSSIRYSVYCLIITCGMFLYRKWMNGREFRLYGNFQVAGKVVIVTGSNTGIGKETALALAENGLHVIMACRSMEKAAVARDEIIAATGNKNVQCMKLNLASFKSIRAFADEFLATGLPLHILINNAGVMGVDRRETDDGLEYHIGVNHFGPFLLTMLLLRRIAESRPSRIINVSSLSSRYFTIDKDDLMSTRKYNRFAAYARSKLANIYFTRALAKRVEDTGITSNSVHPGIAYSDMSRNLSSYNFILQKWVCDLFSKVFLQTTKSGAQTSIFAALDFNLQNLCGLHFAYMDIADPGKHALDDEMAEWLWHKSEEITGIKYEDCVSETILKK